MKKIITFIIGLIIGVLTIGSSNSYASHDTNDTLNSYKDINNIYEVINVTSEGIQGVSIDSNNESIHIDGQDLKYFYFEIGQEEKLYIKVDYEIIEDEEVIKDIQLVEIDYFTSHNGNLYRIILYSENELLEGHIISIDKI